MVTATDNAIKELDAYFADKPKSPIRVYLTPGGCSGPRLALALDEPADKDDTFQQSGYTFVMDKELHQQADPVRIDISHMGFSVESSLQLGGGGCTSSGCASSGCSSGGCSSGGCGTHQ